MQAAALDCTKGREIEGRKILERIPLLSSLLFLSRFLPLRPSLAIGFAFLFFSGLAARNQSALLYRAFGRSIPGLLPLSGEVCQEFIESIGDIGKLIPSRLDIS